MVQRKMNDVMKIVLVSKKGKVSLMTSLGYIKSNGVCKGNFRENGLLFPLFCKSKEGLKKKNL